MTDLVNRNQAIFDAIVAATTDSKFLPKGAVTINVKKFIETFNNHRDRALCTSLDVAQASPDGTDLDGTYYSGADEAKGWCPACKGTGRAGPAQTPLSTSITITAALDALALALTDHKHQWTDRERSLYEAAIKATT